MSRCKREGDKKKRREKGIKEGPEKEKNGRNRVDRKEGCEDRKRRGSSRREREQESNKGEKSGWGEEEMFNTLVLH